MSTVKKRNGTIVEFNPEKIKSAMLKAFEACNYLLSDKDKKEVSKFVESFELLGDEVSVEDIQDKVEKFLCKRWFRVGKAYMLYREKHKEDRFNHDRIKYMEDYAQSHDNAATSSETDANANVTMKNVANLEGEVYKLNNRRIQRLRMKHKLKELYPEVSEQYEKDLEHHIIYTHDEASTPVLKQYCMAVSLYPLMLEGVGNIDGVTPGAPNDLSSFSGQITNLAFLLSSQCKGAVAFGEYFIALNYYIIAEFGENWHEKLDVVTTTEHCHQVRTVKDQIYKAFKQFIWNINQPAGNRGYQCVTEDTELWTPEGFKKLEDLKVGDLCYTYKDGKFNIEPILHLTVKDFDGELLQFSSRDYQQTVTSEHRVLNYKPNSEELRLTEAKDLFEKTAIRVPVVGILEKEPYSISNNKIKLIAALYTDGTFDNQPGHGDPRTSFYVSINRKGYNLLKTIFNEEDIKYSETEARSSIQNVVELRPKKEDIREVASLINYNKKDIADFLFNLNREQLTIFFDTWAIFDGQTRNADNSRLMLQCDNEAIADKLQRLALQAGYNSKIDYRYRRANGVFKESYTRYVIIYKTSEKRAITEYNKIYYKGKVWCPSTNTGIVIFREDNKMPYITGNCPFTNISYYDHTYFDSLFSGFYYPDGTQPQWEAIDCLQRLFMKWFNKLRLKQVLTFPVETMAMVYDPNTNDIIDKEYKDFTAEMYSEGHSFFTYISDSADSLASCCRLKNELAENTFSPTSGLTGVMTGSCNVITLNINRIVQDWFDKYDDNYFRSTGIHLDRIKVDIYNSDFKVYLEDILSRVYKYHIAYKTMLYEQEDKKMFAASNGGYIYISKLYSTIGINGLNEAARYLGLDVSNNDSYLKFLQLILGTIKEQNKNHSINDKKRPFIFNSEVVPAEGLGGKNYNWDKKDGYWVPDDENLYNSYFYNAHDNTSVLDKFILHGRQTYQYTDGGSALHCNLEDHLSKEQYLKLIDFAIEEGTSYFTFNIPNSKCEDCGHIIKKPICKCPKCESENITQYTRVIGYLRPIKAFGNDRQIEASKRIYSKDA